MSLTAKRDTKPTTYDTLRKGDRYRLAGDPWGPTYTKGGGGMTMLPDAQVLPAREFDYREAWKTAARPFFEALPDHVREAFDKIEALARDVPQDAACRVPMTKPMEEVCDGLTVRELAELSFIASSIGHWAPSGDGPLTKGQIAWKVDNVVDQALAKRLGLERDRFHRTDRGVGVRIFEGQVRAHYSDSENWTWAELGLASETLLAETRKDICGPLVTFQKTCDRLKAKSLRIETDKALRSMLDTTQFTVPKGYRKDDCKECGGSPLGGTWTDHEYDCSVGTKMREDAKHAKRLAKLSEAVEFEIECQPEDDGPEGHFASGDDAQDEAQCALIRAEAEWNEWAWCQVKVTARLGDLSASDYLGACNYASEKEFRACPYFEDMKAQALEALLTTLEDHAKALDALGIK